MYLRSKLSPFCNKYEIPPSFRNKFDIDVLHYNDATFQKSVGNQVIFVYEGQGDQDGNCSHSGIVQSVFRALHLQQHGWEIRVYNSSIIRKFYPNWTHPSFLVDEMLKSAIHIILCQGLHCGMTADWHTTDCVEQVKRLQFHPGYPSRNKLCCPAFTGNKMEYLLGAPNHTLPSFMIKLNESEAYYETVYKEAER